jgi:uncharacterized protein YjiS (DUF1127 family)
MSTQFRSPPRTFFKQDGVKLFGANKIGVDLTARKRNNNNSVASDRPPAPLRDGHIVLLAVDVLVALHASFKKWRNHRATLRALADLDEHQLRDIGLTREDALLGHQNSYRAFAELNEIQHASEWVKFHRPAS